MQLTVEKNGMKASRHQDHGKRTGEGTGGVVLHVGGELHAAVTKTLARLSWTAGQFERDGGNRLEVPRLVTFAGAKRSQLAVLTEAAVTAELREAVTGVTCLASVRPTSPRLAAAPIVLARGQEFSPGRATSWHELVESAHSHDVHSMVDEGGIYSW
ncbi:hypothetical protein [Vitiosangium sp. GDMCC 1.1324]|uniref:hypothetical protein n=1 Tax=Vitiosangium sp. (strain GDMCC 1.1324) TaxID=2138576 RepID=UPI000D3C1072|nr:hypothetical protein [Vitiosangium sp. GDMCC 1.1324]PTL79826.1 hypothetical protein DAT35_30775 [Vitiosangium sp. GDMCC 1.1324]